jgi:LuxR family maltose regulon positive regulatory protein
MSTVGQYQPLIARDDLVACLDRMTTRKVTMISAPAGSGKTSLLRAWAERPDRDRRLAVVQVRRDQHDARSFWLDPLDVDRMLAELAEHRGRVILVIDDAHELASTEALAQLARLLASLPRRRTPSCRPAAISGWACTSCA